MKYDLSGACSRKCSLNPGNLPAGAGELIHRWYEEGANRETIMARAAELGVKVTSGSLQRHKSNHLIPAADPRVPGIGPDDDPERKFSDLEVIEAIIQRGARTMQASTTKVSTEQLLSAIALKAKLTEGSVFDALFDALSGDNDDDDLSDLEAPEARAGEDERAQAAEDDDPPLEPPIPGV